MGIGIFFQAIVIGQRETTSSCTKRGSGQIYRENFFGERVGKDWNRLSRKVLKSPSLEVI